MTSCNPTYLATLNVAKDADGVMVQNLSQPSTGCLHDYTLTTEDMKNLSKADVLVINGAGMEGYLEAKEAARKTTKKAADDADAKAEKKTTAKKTTAKKTTTKKAADSEEKPAKKTTAKKTTKKADAE